jgi:hypothetical protein
MPITLDGTNGITSTGGYTGDGISFADNTPSNTLVTTSGGLVGIGTSSPSARLNVTGTSVVSNFESTNNNNVIGILFNGGVGGYIGASASTLQFSNSSGTSVAAINSTNFQFNSGYGSVATAYGCRAWVNFNGTGTVAIRASGNVTSITDNGTGDYTVNFTNAMPDTNYSALANAGDGTNYDVFARLNTAGTTYSTSSLRFKTTNNGGSTVDCNIVTASIHR